MASDSIPVWPTFRRRRQPIYIHHILSSTDSSEEPNNTKSYSIISQSTHRTNIQKHIRFHNGFPLPASPPPVARPPCRAESALSVSPHPLSPIRMKNQIYVSGVYASLSMCLCVCVCVFAVGKSWPTFCGVARTTWTNHACNDVKSGGGTRFLVFLFLRILIMRKSFVWCNNLQIIVQNI